MNKVLTFILVN